MTNNQKMLRRLVSRRNAAYNQRTAAFLSRGAVLAAAEESGRTTLTEAEARTYDERSATIRRLGEQIGALDQQISEQCAKHDDGDDQEDEEGEDE